MKIIIPPPDPTSTPFQLEPERRILPDTPCTPAIVSEVINKVTMTKALAPVPTPSPEAKPPAAPATVQPVHPLACNVAGCKRFGHRFPNEHALQAHKLAVHSTKPMTDSTPPAPVFKCDHPGCNREFQKPWPLAVHKARAHSTKVKQQPHAGAPFKCPACDYSADKRVSLSRHWSGLHLGKTLRVESDPYECRLCGATLATRKAADSHAGRVHHSTFTNSVVKRSARKRAPLAAPPSQALTVPTPPRPPKHVGQFYSKAHAEHGNSMNIGSLEYALESARHMLTHGFQAVEIGVMP